MLRVTQKSKCGTPGVPTEVSETGFYRYNGTPIHDKDRVYYENRGVKFTVEADGDLMPDGIHLKPFRFRTCKRPARAKAMGIKIASFVADYDKLPLEGRPRFSEWITTEKDTEITTELLLSMADAKPQEKIRLIALLWEFSRAKPKSQIELTQPPMPEQVELPPKDMLLWVLEMNGIDLEKARKIIGSLLPERN